MSGREPKWMPLSLAAKFEPMAKDRGVSAVARSKRGFFTQYKSVGGRYAQLDPWWRNRRNNFVKRHMAQVKAHGEKLVDKDGLPTRRHLALIMWAYSPFSAERLKKMLREYEANPARVFTDNGADDENMEALLAAEAEVDAAKAALSEARLAPRITAEELRPFNDALDRARGLYLAAYEQAFGEQPYFYPGDIVQVEGRDGLLWKIVDDKKVRNDVWFKVMPIDPVTGEVAGIVLTKAGQPVDYTDWWREHPEATVVDVYNYTPDKVDLNAYTAANGGPTSFEWHRGLTMPSDDLIAMPQPEETFDVNPEAGEADAVYLANVLIENGVDPDVAVEIALDALD